MHEALETGTHYMALLALTLCAFPFLVGVFTLITQGLPRWVPARKSANWKPFAWAQIFMSASITGILLPQVLGVDPLVRIIMLVPAVCFLITSTVFNVMAFRSPGPK
ncbi:hypothetical protein AB0J35_27825 [Nonomuraea angiospora]|uniref:hypothetical protein n=1 Tax=Nonomuraea angiospora TaxID=46172 RepID=UPI003438DF8B